MPTKRAFLQLLLAALLLVAQHGALTHAIWHAHDRLARSQLPQEKKSPQQSKLCTLDLALTQVLGAVHGDTVVPPTVSPGAERVAAEPHCSPVLAGLPPQSRGPPILI